MWFCDYIVTVELFVNMSPYVYSVFCRFVISLNNSLSCVPYSTLNLRTT